MSLASEAVHWNARTDENMQFLFDFISTERAKIFSSKCCQYGIMDLIDLESVNVLDHLFVSCPEVVAEIYGIFLEKLFGKLKYTLTHPKNIFVSHWDINSFFLVNCTGLCIMKD